MAKAKSQPPEDRQRALVVGVSDYPPPTPKLPAVAADVREMAKLLASKNGAFADPDVLVLTDAQATRRRILEGLDKTIGDAEQGETVFVYLAGHGDVRDGNYFFLGYDAKDSDLAATGVPLAKIKQLFDETRCRRVLIWLDFCHSGGMIARRSNHDDEAAIERVLKVVKGEGKVIVAACTSSQSAYESSSVGHGLFTHALLRGLRGEAKSASGEVTALSLYDFIDKQLANGRQQPVFFGHFTGRIVLMHYADRAASKSATGGTSKPKTRPVPRGTWIMLGEGFLLAESVRTQSDSKVTIVVSPTDGEEEAFLASLRSGGRVGRESLPFAVNNDAHLVRVDEVHSEAASGKQLWTLSFAVESRFGNPMTEMTVNGIGPDEIARRRAGRILLNDPPYKDKDRRDVSPDLLIEAAVEGMNSQYPIRGSAISATYQRLGKHHDWKEFARLKSVFLLKVTDTVEAVVELSIGPVRKNQVEVKFRGRRAKRFSNVEPAIIELGGVCPLK